MGLSISQALGMSEDIRSHSESYILDTEIMLGFAISKTKEYLRAHGEHILTELQEQQFQHMLLRRKLGEPIAYIVGKRSFWDFELVVNDHVLIPRPETEILVELALETLGSFKNKLRIADLGTGSGAVAIAIARTNPRWRVHAVDICPKALGVARHNARNLKASNIKFHKGSWCEGLPDETFDLTVALVRVMWAGLGFIVLSSWCLGVLNAHRKFFLSFAAPILWNAAQIIFALIAWGKDWSEASIATAAAWGVLVGGALQFLIQIPLVLKVAPSLKLGLQRGLTAVKEIVSKLLPD